MQQDIIEGISLGGAGSALADSLSMLLRMVDAYGSSWNAIVITNDDLPFMNAGTSVVVPSSMIITLIMVLLMIVMGPRLLRRARIAIRNYRMRQSIIDECGEIIDDWRELRRSLRGSQQPIIEPIVDARIARIARIEKPCSPTIIESSKDPRDDCDDRVSTNAARIDRRSSRGSKPIVAATVARIIAKNSDDRPQATDASVAEHAKARIVARPGYETGATTMYQDYCSWCDARGIIAVKQKRYGDRLRDLGFEKEGPPIRRTVFYKNVAIKPENSIELEVIEGGKI
jgi:hypothetical protein